MKYKSNIGLSCAKQYGREICKVGGIQYCYQSNITAIEAADNLQNDTEALHTHKQVDDGTRRIQELGEQKYKVPARASVAEWWASCC